MSKTCQRLMGGTECGKPAVARMTGLGAFEWFNTCADCGREYTDWLKSQYEALKNDPESSKYGTAKAMDRDTLYCKWQTCENDLRQATSSETSRSA